MLVKEKAMIILFVEISEFLTGDYWGGAKEKLERVRMITYSRLQAVVSVCRVEALQDSRELTSLASPAR